MQCSAEAAKGLIASDACPEAISPFAPQLGDMSPPAGISRSLTTLLLSRDSGKSGCSSLERSCSTNPEPLQGTTRTSLRFAGDCLVHDYSDRPYSQQRRPLC